MIPGIQIQTEKLTLEAAHKLLGWQEASQQGNAKRCQQLEAEFFDLVENNGLSQEWLELYAQLAADDKEAESSCETTEA